MIKKEKTHKLSILLFVLSCVAIIGLFIVYLLGSKFLVDSSYDSRSVRLFGKIERGKMFDKNGEILAYTELVDNNYIRKYTHPELFCHVIGYADKKYGFSGLESQYNNVLQGRGQSTIITKLDNIFSKDKSGENLNLTLDLNVQERAKRLLGNNKGAIVVSNPKDGSIICSYSYPTYNPFDIENELQATDDRLLDRVDKGQYTPGSVMKIITAMNLLEEGAANETYMDNGYIDIGDGRVFNYAKRSYGNIDLKEAFENSVNTFFIHENKEHFDSYVGLTEQINELIEKNCKGVYGFHIEKTNDDFANGILSIGQGKITASPMAINLLTQAVYNEGYFYTPKYISTYEDKFKLIERKEYGKRVDIPIGHDTFKSIKEFMYGVVREGTAKGFGLWSAGGKTGTAELGNGRYNYFFTGFFHDESNPRVITIVLENSVENGYNKSVSIFKKILNM